MDNYTKICIGKMPIEKVKNIVQEVKRIYSYLDDVWPQGERELLPDIKVTKDTHDQYYIVINQTALSYLFIFMSKITSELDKKDVELPVPPNFLSGGYSKSE